MPKKKVVVIGGGNGSAITVVALKQNLDLFDISTIISMSDSGGFNGALRYHYDCLPPADIMRSVFALSKYDTATLKKVLYNNRLEGLEKISKKIGTEKAPYIGAMFFMFLIEQGIDFITALRALEQAVEAVGHSYPATLDKTELCAELENGQVVKSETAIDKPTYDLSLAIKRLWLEPTGNIYEGAKKVIEEADYIIFGPGSLHTSVIASVLPGGAKEAIGNSKAKLVFVSGDAYVADGETCPHTLSGTIKTLENYLPRPLDLIIYNARKLDLKQKEIYTQKKWIQLIDDKENTDARVKRIDYERTEGGLCAIKLGKILKNLLKDDEHTTKPFVQIKQVAYGNNKKS